MEENGRKRVVIENVKPEIDCGRFAIKRVVGEKVIVTASIFGDGHDSISARLLYRRAVDNQWQETPMLAVENDRWTGEFVVGEIGIWCYTVEAWNDAFQTWQRGLRKKSEARQVTRVDLLIGIGHVEEAAKRASSENRQKLLGWSERMKGEGEIDEAVRISLHRDLSDLVDTYPDRREATTYGKELFVVVDREKALFSSWYELFPRACSPEVGRHGTFRDCERLLPEIEKMGFDVLYLPPIHPIGRTNRKGKNNVLDVKPDDVGSPWAIGSEEGGHGTVHPQLGTLDDFERFVHKAEGLGIEVALDLAFQCSPDHPYVKEHPEWFRWRPDATVQFAENPPKRYEDIIPLNFETEQWHELWEELRKIVVFWIERGVRIFRVDNPHTKPLPFWEWLIREVKRDHPEVLFLSEAFTRPKVMNRLAKVGFTQSYTYFTWRNTKRELTEYLTELTRTEVAEYLRPNFWPNTPDILPEHLQYGGRPAFMTRLVLAATLSSNYGIYGPAFELCVQEAVPGKEEYVNSEKYEIREWEREHPGSLRELITRVNRIRRENPALQTTRNLQFLDVENDHLLFYTRATEDLSNVLLILVNLDPFHSQSGWVRIPIRELGIDPSQPYLVHDLLSDDKYIWQGERNYVELSPHVLPASIFKVRKRLKRESDFDYFV